MVENISERLIFPASKIFREYGSNIYFIKGEKTTRLQFRASITYAGIFMQKYYIFHLNKHDIYINGIVPDDHSYRLAHECSKVFYPLIVFCSADGNLIGLRNDVIRNRWQKAKPNIEREFVGKAAENYIKETENSIYHTEKILGLIRKDIFFHTFFSLKYGYNSRNEVAKDNKFPLLAFKDSLKVKGTQKIIQQEDTINAIQEGEISDDSFFNYGDVLNSLDYGGGKINGNFRIDYKLDTNFVIDAIHANFSLKKENHDELMDIKMESYYLREYPLQPITDEDTIDLGKQIEKNQKKMNKKSLWERFQKYINEPL